MKIFIAWSGEQSKTVALALRWWLTKMLQTVNPWLSEIDIDKGKRWSAAISNALEETDFGIVCLTQENLDSNWIHFESGALAKSVEDAYVGTYLYGVRKSDVKKPLGEFQHTVAEKDDTKRLIQTINNAVREKNGNALDDEELSETFEILWPHLEQKLSEVPKSTMEPTPKTSDTEILEEVLDTVRDLNRIATRQEPRRGHPDWSPPTGTVAALTVDTQGSDFLLLQLDSIDELLTHYRSSVRKDNPEFRQKIQRLEIDRANTIIELAKLGIITD